jgi:predicted membrane channel-forming protein YqfA (hemolysin III family)
MRLTPPKAVTFWISVALAVLGLLSQLALFTLIPVPAFWLLFIGFVLLALGLMVKGL